MAKSIFPESNNFFTVGGDIFYKKMSKARERKETNFEKARLRIKSHGEDDTKAAYFLMLAHYYAGEEEDLAMMEAVHLSVTMKDLEEKNKE